MSVTDNRNLSPKEAVITFLDLMRSATPEDTEKAVMMFAEDASFWVLGNLPMSGELRGREEIMKRFRRGHGRTVQGSKSLDIGKVIAEGEFVAAEWVSRRKVIDADDYVNTFFGLFQVRDGKIVSLREYMDTLAVKEAGWDRATIPAPAPIPARA